MHRPNSPVSHHGGSDTGEIALRILIVDDDASLTAMLEEYLGTEGFEVTAIQQGSAGAVAAVSGDYAAVVLDIMLPGISGIEVLRRIRQSSQVPIIMLTAKGDDMDRVVGLEMGADDYISKPFLARELLARLKAVLRRTAAQQARVPREIVSFGDLLLSPASRKVTWGDVALDLTTTEFNLLELLMRSTGELVTKDTLTEKGLGRRRTSYDRSVDVHIGNLRRKLASASSGQVEIHTVRGLGYSLGPAA
jgi:two-component system, OmpR family, response regulator